MTNQDVFKALLCSYGYDRNIKIETYRSNEGYLGYEIYAENKEGDCFHEMNCEGFMFIIYQILDYMKTNNADFKSNWWNYSIKQVSDEKSRNSLIATWDERDRLIAEDIIKMQPCVDWMKENNPCPTCKINKKDHWDIIHYKCELNHNHSCKILLNYLDESNKFRENLYKNTSQENK